MHERRVICEERVRQIPKSFSWIDREILHSGFLFRLTQEETLLYFFLTLVAGPEGTSFWGYRSMGRLLKLSEDEVRLATAGLLKKGLIAFRFPTYQVLSLPLRSSEAKGAHP